MDNITFAPFAVTCRVEGCENYEITIELSAALGEGMTEPLVYCGPCSQIITDVVPSTLNQ